MPERSVERQGRDATSRILLVLAIAGIAYAILQAAVAPALPELQRELDIPLDDATWILTSILLSASVLTPVIGKMGDLYGKKRILIAVLVVFALGTAISGFAASLPLMLIGRVLQGTGGGIFPLAFGLIRDLLPRGRVAGAIGLLSATMGIGGGFGIVAAGLIVKFLDYRFLFWIPLIPIVIATIALWRFLPASTDRRPGSINWPGAMLLGVGLTALLLAISQGRSWGWTSLTTLGLFALAIVAFTGWVRVERAAPEPLISMEIMGLRGVWTANLVALLVGVGMFGSFIVTAQYLQMPESSGYGFGKDVLASGLFLLPAAIMMLLSGLFIGNLERRFGARPLNILGAILSAGGFGFLALFHQEPWHFLLAITVIGLGNGLCFASLAGVVVLAVPRYHVGAATGVNTIMRTVGSSLGSAIPGTILAESTVAATGLPSESAFATIFWLIAGAMVVAILAALLIPARERPGAGVIFDDAPAPLAPERPKPASSRVGAGVTESFGSQPVHAAER
jgi:MFS family permease